MADLIISALLELLFEAIGRRLLSLFGWRQPHQISSILTGMTFWLLVGCLPMPCFIGEMIASRSN